jgi:hypothetical protein
MTCRGPCRTPRLLAVAIGGLCVGLAVTAARAQEPAAVVQDSQAEGAIRDILQAYAAGALSRSQAEARIYPHMEALMAATPERLKENVRRARRRPVEVHGVPRDPAAETLDRVRGLLDAQEALSMPREEPGS